MLSFAAFFRWLQLKRFQFELTIPLYMLTSTEKFLIYSCMFLITAMVVIAVVLYFPEHIAIMASRATFYWAGEEPLTSTSKDTIITSIATAISSTSVASATPLDVEL